MIALALSAAWAGTQVDLGGYGGVLLPSSEHELYDPALDVHRGLSPAPVLGARIGVRPVRWLGFELEGDLGASGVAEAGTALLAGWRGNAGLFVPVTEKVTPFLLAGTGFLAVSSADDAVGRDNDAAFHVGLGAEIAVRDRLRLRPELRDYLTGHYQVVSTPGQHFEALIGLTWVAVPAADRDPDGDGIVGRADGCPEIAETKNGWQDEDGCPDGLASLKLVVTDPSAKPVPGATITVDGAEVGRTDAAGILVVSDRIPGTALSRIGVAVNARTALEGAEVAEAISLIEGETSRSVQLQWLPGAVKVVTRSQQGAIVDAVVSFRGPLAHDDVPIGPDGEEFFVLAPGPWTLLVSAEAFGIERRELEIRPNERSLVVIEVELAPPVVQTTRDEVVLLEAVQFDFDKATVKAESMPLLDEIANNLLRYQEIKRIEVQGHTDSKGSDRYNLGLSQQRVNEVMALLQTRGIAADRITSVGYGEKCPMSVNDTEAHRAENRRVQIFILDPAPAGGVPCHAGIPARKAEATTVTVPAAPK